METLNEFISRRKAEIIAEIARLRGELRQITAAESADHSGKRVSALAAAHGGETIKEQVVKILTDHPKGMTAKEIQAQLKVRFDRDVKRESLSPQLSRLGADGTIAREGKTWVLPLVEKAFSRFREDMASRHQNGAPPSQIENPQELHS